MNTKISSELYKKAVTFMPGGVNSPVRAFGSVGREPLFIERSYDDRIIDADGNEYIDYICSWGPDILGHAHPAIIKAVKSACDNGLTYGACHKGEIELAEKIKLHFPSMELLRLVNSGTEAVMSAVRAARGFTGRDKIVKFIGCYHGHSDGLLVKAVRDFSQPLFRTAQEFPQDTLKIHFLLSITIQIRFRSCLKNTVRI